MKVKELKDILQNAIESGGADSYDTEQVTSSFALVRTSPMPPPAATLSVILGQRSGNIKSNKVIMEKMTPKKQQE